MRMRIKLPIRKPRPNPVDRMLCDIQAAGSFPFATTDNRPRSWIAFVETKRGRTVATLIGFDEPGYRDMEYERAKSFGGNFNQIAKLRGTELAVRQYVEGRGWQLDARPIIRG